MSATSSRDVLKTRRPLGIYLVALLLLLLAAFNGLDAYLTYEGWPFLQYPGISNLFLRYGINGVNIALAVFCIVGLLSRQRWAWYLTMMITGVALFISIWAHFNDTQKYGSMLLETLIVLYLNQRSVQDFFRKPEPGLVGQA